MNGPQEHVVRMTTSSENNTPRFKGEPDGIPSAESVADLRKRVRDLEASLLRLREENAFLKRQWHEVTHSYSWRIVSRLSRLARGLAPKGSRRRALLKTSWRSFVSLKYRGLMGWGRRTIGQLRHESIGQLRLLRARSRPFTNDGRPVILFVSHIGGGGTERHIRDMAAHLAGEGVRAISARPDGHGRLCFEEHDSEWNMIRQKRIRPSREAVASVLNSVSPSLVHVHHRMGVPDTLFDTIREHRLPTDWTLHDYHAVCPRIHLNDGNGRYCGEPATEGCRSCLKRLGDYHGEPTNPDVQAWRDGWRRRLVGARRIYVPSNDVRTRMMRYFPELQFFVRPHIEPNKPGQSLARSWVPGDRVRVAVIGTIGAIKGSARLLEAAEDARRRNLPLEFVLVGTSDQELRLLSTGRVEVTGPYRETEIWDRLEDADCHVAWLPSIWPETYMYTLSVALAAGLRPVVYDLGAQAERVAEAGIGCRLPLETDAAALNRTLMNQAAMGDTSDHSPKFAEYPEFLNDYYGLTIDELKFAGVNDIHNSVPSGSVPAPHTPRSDHARLYQHHRQLSS
jgi:glycosyltransferase involved in cell wall biosynthesis